MSTVRDFNCAACASPRLRHKYSFSKETQQPVHEPEADNDIWELYECLQCGLWQLRPVPTKDELERLYQGRYFERRTDRGYDNYAGERIRRSVQATLEKNLADLNFYDWERELLSRDEHPQMLEIGCAAGHALDFFAKRGWATEGIDVAEGMVQEAQARGLNVKSGDFLKEQYAENSFHLISLWATLEHLPEPSAFFKKIAALLRPQGKLFLSTCHLGFFARIYGKNWRYLNVPEHIYYFSKKSLELWPGEYGLGLEKAFSYGSGFTARSDAGIVYRASKKLVDQLAKHWLLGDMIVCSYRKSS